MSIHDWKGSPPDRLEEARRLFVALLTARSPEDMSFVADYWFPPAPVARLSSSGNTHRDVVITSEDLTVAAVQVALGLAHTLAAQRNTSPQEVVALVGGAVAQGWPNNP